MSEAKKPDATPDPLADLEVSTPSPASGQDAETDALLESLMSDPFPSGHGPSDEGSEPRLRPGPKLHVPRQRVFSQDEVTVVGHTVEELLAVAQRGSTAPPGRPTAPAPGQQQEVTVVGKSLSELLAASSAADSFPPLPADLPNAVQGGLSAATQSAHTPVLPPRNLPFGALRGSIEPDMDDDETRILHLPTNFNEAGSRAAFGRTVSDIGQLRTESFAPPTSFSDDFDDFDGGPGAPAPIPASSRLPSEVGAQTAQPEPPTPYPNEPATQARMRSALVAAGPAESSAGFSFAPGLPAPASGRFKPPSQPPQAVSHDGNVLDPIAREAWIARAEWLEEEAQAAADPELGARTLLIASELWSIVGEVSRAREVATRAASVDPTSIIVGRQQRWLSALEGDWKSVATTLEFESAEAATTEARVHAANFCGDVQRVVLADGAAANAMYALASRAHAQDPRAHLMQLAERLAESREAPAFEWPEDDGLLELTRATGELSRLRSANSLVDSPLGAFEQAAAALARGERAQAAHALLRLSELDGLRRPAQWLAACLLAPEAATRPRSMELLTALLASGAGPSARLALAARALEQGDDAALSRSLNAEGEVFSAADRVALWALGGAFETDPGELVSELAREEATRALSTAALLARGEGAGREPLCGEASPRAALGLGLALADATNSSAEQAEPAREAFRERVAAFAEFQPDDALARGLQMELALARRDSASVAAALAEWPNPTRDPAAQRDRELASALVQEIGGNAAAARFAYERALSSDPSSEVAARALCGELGYDPTELLERLAEAEGSGVQAALHFIEAALRAKDSDSAAFDARLERAAELEPKLALAHHLGEQRARSEGNLPRLLAWLRARRAAGADPLELGMDLVREAELVEANDAGLAASLLKEAVDLRPNDVALNELLERSVARAIVGGAPTGDSSRARWREAAAEHASGNARTRLLLQASLEYERAEERAGAVRCARQARQTNHEGFAQLTFARTALGSADSAILAEELLARVKGTEDATEKAELYSELASIDAARADMSSALLWQSAILESSPNHLPALRQLEHAYISQDRAAELEAIEVRLAETLTGSDAAAAARLGARLRLAAGDWRGVRTLAEVAAREAPEEIWALRALSAQARVAKDYEMSLRVDRKLHELAVHPLDAASLALRAAQAALLLERPEDAQRLLESALDQVPDHAVALLELARVLEAREDYASAARVLETVAEASLVEAHKVEAWYEAACLWLDRAGQADRGRSALEEAVAIDSGHEEAVVRLQAIYVARGDRQQLAQLLEKRLERTSDPEERIAIEVARGRALAEIGEPAAAKAALAAALDANPDHLEALEVFAELCLSEGDWLGGERALIRLARHAVDPERQAAIYRKLGELYDDALPNPERAELAYQEVRKRAPEDLATVDRLVNVYGRMGAADKAVALQSEILAQATQPEQRRERTLRLALVLEQMAANRKGAEQLLERARKDWPHDAQVLRALADLHFRAGDARAAHILLDRAAADARRALVTGRFEPSLFESLATVAELRGAPETAAVAHATLAALLGDELPVRGAGPQAGEPRLDDLLAPDLFHSALRNLLAKTGNILDAAYPIDMRALRAGPLHAESAPFVEYVQQLARAFGFVHLEVLVSPALGANCLPASSTPAVLVLGQALLDSADDAARYCLILRALKILQGRAAALARTAPIDLWPVAAALLSSFAPSFSPQGVDGRKLADAQARIQAVLPPKLDDDVASLALEVTALIGNRASQLATAAYQWGNRCALLAVGDPLAMLRALSWSSGSSLAARGPERLKWIGRNAEARDLAIFSVSEPYAEARRRLHLGG